MGRRFGLRRSFISPRCGGRGYTILELLIVMGIIMILVGMVASGLSSMTRSRRVRNSTSSVLNVIHMARSRAISDNAITHVRVENDGPNDQRISIYRFPKAADAIRATTNTEVANLGPDAAHMGWNELSDPDNGYCNYRMEGQKLEPNCWFVTNYDKASMWDSSRNRILSSAPSTGNVPKIVGSNDSDGRMLYFKPDGTASDNLLFYIRDDTNLMWVRVYKGGEVKSGDVTSWVDLVQVN